MFLLTSPREFYQLILYLIVVGGIRLNAEGIELTFDNVEKSSRWSLIDGTDDDEGKNGLKIIGVDDRLSPNRIALEFVEMFDCEACEDVDDAGSFSPNVLTLMRC